MNNLCPELPYPCHPGLDPGSITLIDPEINSG